MEVRRANVSDRNMAVGLMRYAFGDSGPADQKAARWEWLFSRNSGDHRYFYLVAETDGAFVAQYATLPTRMQHADQSLLGLLSLDTATHPSFEKKGLFTKLALRLYLESSAECPLIYGFPNGNSAPGFYRRLDWRPISPFPLLVRPLGGLHRTVSPGRRAAAILLDLAATPVMAIWDRAVLTSDRDVVRFADFGEWADEIWRSNSPRFGTCAVRDRAFLQWRFVESPFEYERFAVIRGREVLGFAVLAITKTSRATVVHLMEVMTMDPDDRVSAAKLISACLQQAKKCQAAMIDTIATTRHPHRSVFRRFGFFAVPPRLVGARSFGFRVNGALKGDAEQLTSANAWYVSGADLDFV